MSAGILYDTSGPVVTLTINRPGQLNAMDSAAHLALSEALDAAAADDDVRVVVLTGSGKTFSVGRDLKELAETDDDRKAEIAARWQKIVRLTDRFDYPKPTIAKVRGYALGGGFELAMACDLIVASADATFALPEVTRGLIPFAGGVHRLPRQVPQRVALGYLMTGRRMTAGRAYDLGLVNEVTEEDGLDLAVAGWIDDILAAAPLSVRSVLQCARGGMGMPLSNAISSTYPAEERRLASRDAIEGPLAFSQKRQPVWTGN